MDCILHIGANKAGSTSLQKALANNGPKLLRHNLYYPNAGRTFSGNKLDRQIGLRFAMTPIDFTPIGALPQYGLNTVIERARYHKAFKDSFDAEISNIPQNGTVILSDEDLFIFSTKDLSDNLKHFLSARFNSIKIIFYFRRPDKYITSFYSQHIKMGGHLGLSEFVDEYLQFRPYYDVLKDWISAFGIENITAKACERGLLEGGDVVADFCSHIKSTLHLETNFYSNPGLSTLGCEVLRLINENFGFGYNNVPRIFCHSIEKHFVGDDHYLSGEMRQKIYSANTEDHSKLSTVLNLKQGRDIYRLEDMLVDAPRVSAHADSSAAVQIANVMLEMYRHSDFQKPRPA